MKLIAGGAALAGMWLVLGSGPSDTLRSPGLVPPSRTAAAEHPAAVDEATLTEVVRQYCAVCHNDAQAANFGNLSLQSFDVEQADVLAPTAERMIRKLRAGMMPPPGMPRPAPDTLLALVETLESKVDEAARVAPNIGERRFTRLTRAEYERVIKDLLALEVDASRWLPPDVLVGSFDNTANAQGLSTTLLDSFLRAAGEVSRLALGDPSAVSSSTKYRNPVEVSQHAWDRIEGTPFGTRGGMVVIHDFPADGEYVFEAVNAVGDRMVEEDVDISIDDEPVALIMLEHARSGVIDAVRSEPIFVRAGQHKVSAAFVNRLEGPYDDRFNPPGWSWAATQAGDYGITGLTHLTELLITGPNSVAGVSETASRQKVFTCRPASAAEERPCAESILTELMANAYRRSVTKEDVADLMGFYDEDAPTQGFEIGVRSALQALLSSPEFVFRFEREPADAQPGQTYRLSDIDLATRLSFFLWATAPDEELIAVAESGGLSDDRVLEQQVARMLKDPRSEALSTRFLHQWLRLQDVGKVWPESYLFPGFSKQLADGMVHETEMLFQHLVQEDLSPLGLFSADYTFLNQRLAEHYGIPGVFGEEFRRVTYPNDQRRGIFGHGSVLQLTSMSDRTSPVLRGKWVMEVVMGTPPPPPPANVPAFEASPPAAGGRRLTTRERMEAHRKSQICNSCHRFMDPIGLAMDNFDVTGKWRIRENMQALDTRGVFFDGTAITNSKELSQVLMKIPTTLVRNFTDRLMAYAIGRPVEYYDQPTVRAIVRDAEEQDYRMSAFILGVVKSDPFRMRQAQSTAANSNY